MPAPDPQRPFDRPRFIAGLLLAVALPALAAAAAVLAFAGGDAVGGPAGSPSHLARAAEAVPSRMLGPAGTARALRPLVAESGRAGVQPSPLEPLEGGVRPAPPQRISIPAAGVDAVVEPVAEHHGALRVPHIGRAGWWDGGPRPGENGRAVLIGHLDTHHGPGLFARVPRLPPGTSLAVTDRRGDVHRYNVVGGAEVRKDRFPVDSVYGGADRPVLVLVTCGGPFVQGRGYRDNVLLYARAA